MSQPGALRSCLKGFLWGSDPSELTKDGLFDIVLLSDIINNHSEHGRLLSSCASLLRQGGQVLVAFLVLMDCRFSSRFSITDRIWLRRTWHYSMSPQRS
jgi:hypothetical protein